MASQPQRRSRKRAAEDRPDDASAPKEGAGTSYERDRAKVAALLHGTPGKVAADADELRALLTGSYDPRLPAPAVIDEDDDDEDDARVFREATEPDAEEERAVAKRRLTKWLDLGAKSLIGVLLLIFAVWVPVRQLFQVSSAEALVNAQIVTLRAPIDGVVGVAGGIPGIGVEVVQGSDLLRIINPRVDLVRFSEAARAVEASLDRRRQLTADLRTLRLQQAALVAQLEEFRLARIDYLTALIVVPGGGTLRAGDVADRVPFLRARLGLANPEGAEANVFDDALDAAVRDYQSSVGLISDGIVASKTLGALNAGIVNDPISVNARLIELNALHRGIFIGDSYNDKPSSGQRLDTIEIEIARLESDLALNIADHARLVEAETLERTWVERMAEATIDAPVNGRVWEVLTAPGEQVVLGQELVRMLDCANPLVTAAVSEAVYNQLAVGMSASFTFREGGEAMMGEVVQLTGFAAAPANLAITPSALRAESYRVTVAVPEITAGNSCAVGRTGRVVFDTAG